MSTRIIVDSTVDMAERYAKKVIVVPLSLHFGEETFIDGVTIDRKRFYERLVESDILPTTSQPSPAAFGDVFDEVTAALDPEMVREVLDVMLELAEQGLTMVIVTHEMQFARAIADRIMFLDGGKVVEETDPETFFTNPSSERARQFLSTFSFDKHTVHLQENDAE